MLYQIRGEPSFSRTCFLFFKPTVFLAQPLQVRKALASLISKGIRLVGHTVLLLLAPVLDKTTLVSDFLKRQVPLLRFLRLPCTDLELPLAGHGVLTP